jgi:hypothetical protein
MLLQHGFINLTPTEWGLVVLECWPQPFHFHKDHVKLLKYCPLGTPPDPNDLIELEQ